jgi:1-acyl-sn-glycerol-3-phosphate acyltransferase
VTPPPRWIRRLLLIPLVFALAGVTLGFLPLWLVVAVLASPFTSGWLRPPRLFWLITVYLLVEVAGLTAMFGMWLAAGFGVRLDRPGFQRAHYRLAGLALRVLFRQARWVLRLTVDLDGATPDSLPTGRPLLVLSRHAGPGDSFLLIHALINWYDREPRIVLKNSLLWDPIIDVLLNRLPNRFIVPGSGHEAEAQIAELASDLDDDDALVIFPEGGNFTPARWAKAITRLRRLGLHAMARRAERMRNVLPPRPGGVLAALEASPRADVVLVAHTGVDHLRTVADVWRALPMDKIIVMQWWRQTPQDVPAGSDARIEWLYGWWAHIDEWISTHRPVGLPPPDLPVLRRRGPAPIR